MVTVALVVLRTNANGRFIARPRSASDAAHDVPGHCDFEDSVDALAAVEDEAETAVNGLTDADAATVVEGNETHAARRVAGEALDCHIGGDVGAIFDVGGLAERAVCAAAVMMVAAKHNGTDLAASHQLVKSQGNLQSPGSVLVEN